MFQKTQGELPKHEIFMLKYALWFLKFLSEKC